MSHDIIEKQKENKIDLASECPDAFNKVVVEKIDLDTVGSFFLHRIAGRVNEGAEIVAKRGQADQVELSDPAVLCIECGGSGDIAGGNFDHHAEGIEESAVRQTLKTLPKEKLTLELIHLTNLIEEFDLNGGERFFAKYPRPEFPGITDLMAGINLVHARDPKMALLEGEKLLKEIVDQKINPYGQIDGFDKYAAAKKTNDQNIEKVRQEVDFFVSESGRINIGWLKTEYFGAPQIVYQEGAKKFGKEALVAVVAHNPAFGPNKNENKFTVGLNLTPQEAKEKSLSLKELAEKLNAIDGAVNLAEQKSWGGPATGTIIGSPKGGSAMTMEEVLEIFKKNY